MKRFLAVLFLLATVMFTVAPAQAAGLKLVSRDLYFRTLANGSVLDSSFTTRGTGIESSAEQKDTTAAFSSLDWTFPGAVTAPTTVSDTTAWLRVTVTPEGTSPTVAADTLGVIMQVSDDEGSNWTSVVWTSPRIDPDVAAMGQAAILETGSSNNFAFVLRQAMGGVTLGGPFFALNTAPTDKNVYGFRLIRFIFAGDHTGKYKCRLEGFQNGND